MPFKLKVHNPLFSLTRKKSTFKSQLIKAEVTLILCATLVRSSCKPCCRNPPITTINSMCPLTDSTNVIMVAQRAHGDQCGKEAQKKTKHLNLLAIQVLFNKYLIFNASAVYCPHPP